MRVIARVMAVLCALIGRVFAACSGTPDSSTPSEHFAMWIWPGFEFRVALRFLREGRMQTVLIIVGVAAGGMRAANPSCA